jgi:hypothetical protein
MKSTNLLTSLVFAIVLLSAEMASATNTLTIVSGQTDVNTTATIAIEMENDDNVVAFQVDIPIPSQLSYISGTVVLNSDRIIDHMVSATLLPGSILRIMGYSLTNAPFAGNSGELVTFQLQAQALPGTYALNFSTAVLGDNLSNNILTSAQNGTIMVLGPDIYTSSSSVDFGRVPLLGAEDRTITLFNTGNTDLHIQQITSSNGFFSVVGPTAFTIGAGSSTTLQLHFSSEVKATYSETMIIHSDDADQGALPVQMTAVAFAVNELHTGSMFSFSGHEASLGFTMNNMEPVIGFQFDLILPEPLTYVMNSALLSSRKADHIVSANMVNDNTLRVVAFSTDNQSFSGHEGLILTIDFQVEGVGGNYGITMNQAVIGDSLGLNAISAYTGGVLEIAAADIAANSSINFGDVSILETSTQGLIVNNYGNDTLKISSVQITDSHFSTLNNFPLLINPGASASLDVTFGSLNEGTTTGTMRLFSNDPDEDPYSITLTGNAYIPNYINVVDSAFNYGDTMFVNITADNLEPFTGFQFDLIFSDSLTCLTTLASLGTRAGDHLLQVSDMGNHTLRVLAFSMSQSIFSGNEGTIVSIPFVGDSAVFGTLSLTLANAILGNAQSQNILWGVNSGEITIMGPQEIALQAGWNILSFNVSPDNVLMTDMMQPLIDSSSLVKVIDESGGFIQNIPGLGWLNTIGDMANTEGYYIKLSANDTLYATGTVVQLPFTIPLYMGWNIMGYPLRSDQDGLAALQTLINNNVLVKLINESGGFIQNIPGLGWLNTVGDFKPGEGYYIKVNADTDIELSSPVQTSTSSSMSIESSSLLFSKTYTNNPYFPMHIIIPEYVLTHISVAPGDEMAVFDDGRCVGTGVVPIDPTQPIYIVASMDDPETETVDGYIVGNTPSFKYMSKNLTSPTDIYAESLWGMAIFQPMETFVCRMVSSPNGLDNGASSGCVVHLYPNPARDNLFLDIQSSKKGNIKIELLNMSGQLIEVIYDKETEEGRKTIEYELIGKTSGIYHIMVTHQTTDYSKTKHYKLIINQ